MKSRIAAALGVFLLCAAVAFAQDTPPKVEVSLDYSYVHANPQNNSVIPTFSLNGGGGSVAYYFSKYVGIEAEFEGYGSYTHNFTIPATSPYCLNDGDPCPVSAQGNLFTYNVGPIVKYRTKHFEPFVEALFGGAHSNFYGNLFKDCTTLGCTTLTNSPSNNAFDFIIGGGIDIPVGTHVAIRPVQFDYLLTRFGNAFTSGNNNQSNFRYQAGVVFRFGGAPPPPPPNHSPVASCSANPGHVIDGSGETVLARADASDPDNDPLTYSWTATGGAIDGTGSQVRWNPAGVALGAYTITARVDDGRGGTTTCSAEVRVDPRPNRPPTISCSATPGSVPLGGRVHITAVASDPDNDPLTFGWETTGGHIAGSGKEVDLDTTGLAATRYTVTGHVNDGRGGTADCRADFTVEPPPVEAKLAIRSIYFPTALPSPTKPDQGLVESQQKTLTSLASDFKEYLALKPDAQLELQGHADHRGAPDYNKALSERRVEITKKFLVGLGIPAASLTTKAYGEEDNMTPEQVKALVEQHPSLTQEQRDKILKNLKVVTLAQNRRVDVTLSNTGQQSVRQFPFNAEDALTLLSPTGKKK